MKYVTKARLNYLEQLIRTTLEDAPVKREMIALIENAPIGTRKIIDNTAIEFDMMGAGGARS